MARGKVPGLGSPCQTGRSICEGVLGRTNSRQGCRSGVGWGRSKRSSGSSQEAGGWWGGTAGKEEHLCPPACTRH